MDVLICYSSKTGNTRKIAEAIQQAVPYAAIHPVESAPEPSRFDLVFMGFWVDKGTADPNAKNYMSSLKTQKVALFATLGAYPDSQHAQDSLDNAATLIPDCNIVARFICQGAIDPKLTDWMRTLPAEHPHAPNEERIQRWADAASHPDAEDCRNAQLWAENVVATLN